MKICFLSTAPLRRRLGGPGASSAAAEHTDAEPISADADQHAAKSYFHHRSFNSRYSPSMTGSAKAMTSATNSVSSFETLFFSGSKLP